MPYVAVPDKAAGDPFTQAMWQTYVEGNLNGGVQRPIYDSGVLSIATASIVIASIPQTFAHLRLECYLRGDTAATVTNAFLRFNGDSTANYDYELSAGSGGTPVAAESFGVAQIYLGDAPANTAGANLFSSQSVVIPHYSGSTNNKALTAVAGTKIGTATGNMVVRTIAGFWRSNAAITQITLLPSAGNFAAGSRLTLYGLGYI